MSNVKNAAFRRGFLRAIAEQGLTPSEFMDKAAGIGISDVLKLLTVTAPKQLGELATGASKLVGTGARLGTAAAIGVPLAAGMTLGYLGTRPQGVDREDVEALREQDLIANYERSTERLRRRKQTAMGVRA